MGFMKSLFGGAQEPKPPADLRDTLFGDLPLDRWVGTGAASQEFPWNAFVAARADVGNGQREKAVEKWQEIVNHPGLEPRHYVQAWYFLRLAGQKPPEELARLLLGVVVEVGMEQGLDLLAAYPDYAARYYNFSGKGVVWEHPNDSMNQKIDELLEASRRVVAQIGPWQGVRPPAPPKDFVRLCFLTPSGLHFGQAPLEAMSKDPIGGEVLYRAGALMQALMGLTNRPAA